MVRLFLGLLKGAVLGAAIGYGAESLGLTGGWLFLVYGVIGGIVGLLVGRPIWSHLFGKDSTVVTSVLKGAFGFGVGIGLYELAHRAAHDPSIALAGPSRPLTAWTYVFGGLVGAIYGAWVEVDDPPGAGAKDEKKKPAA